MAERLAEGKELFRDLGVQHTSLVMFIFSGVARVFRDPFSGLPPSYEVYLSLSYCVTAVVVLLTGCLLQAVGAKKEVIFLGIALTFLGMYAAEGWCINFEPFVLLFGLSSQLLLLASRQKSFLIFSGFLAGLAFICKQYGLFVIASSGLMICSGRESWKHKLEEALFIGLSFLVPPLLYVLYLSHAAPGGIAEVLESFSGRWYKKEPLSFPEFLRMAICVTPFIIFVPFGVPWKEFRDNPALRVCTFAFILAMLQGFVRQYFHYYLHCIPYAVALSSRINTDKVRPLLTSAVLLFGVVGASASGFVQLDASRADINVREKQRALARNINRHVPERTRVFLIGPPFFMYLCHFLPPNDLVPGYNFLHNYSPEEIHSMLETSEVVLIWIGNNEYVSSIVEPLKEKGFDLMADMDALGFKPFSQIIHGPSQQIMVTMLSRNPRGETPGENH